MFMNSSEDFIRDIHLSISKEFSLPQAYPKNLISEGPLSTDFLLSSEIP